MTTTILCKFTFNSLLRSSVVLPFLGFSFYFEWLSLERGSGIHCMVYSCSDGFDVEIEWLFQLKENEEIETMFQ